MNRQYIKDKENEKDIQVLKIKNYIILYRDFLLNRENQEIIKEVRSKINYINSECLTYLEFFARLDNSFDRYSKVGISKRQFGVFSIKYFKNKNWNGIWLRATGIDSLLYLHWLSDAIKNKNEYKNTTIIDEYKKAHPNETQTPYSIIIADRMFKKHYK